MMKRRYMALVLAGTLGLSLCACESTSATTSGSDTASASTETEAEAETDNTEETGDEAGSDSAGTTASTASAGTKTSEMTAIEDALNLANMGAEWSLDDSGTAWTLTIVTAVTNPEIEDEQGVSVCVPAAYVKGVDTDGDGTEDATSGTATGTLVIDNEASVTSTNGQVYTAATAPVIINTGAAGYSEQSNQTASSTYAEEGYINVACGNRGKQSTVTDESGNTVYTGDAPCCLVDQKNAVRFVKYNILLGNLPGSVDYFVSTGGSGGGAHATMLAATSNNPDFYDYEIEAGAVGVYKDSDGNYITSVTIDGQEVALSDGMWGAMPYSAITSLAEADMALAFEYYLDTTYSFNTDFQKQTAQYLAAEYMEYINGKNLSINEAEVGFDVDGDGDAEDTVALTIEYDESAHADTNGYYGTYLNLYLDEFQESLQAYLNRLDNSDGWTWFDADGNALSDDDVAAMTIDDKAQAFIEGRYVKGSSGSGGMEGGPGGSGGSGGPGEMSGEAPEAGDAAETGDAAGEMSAEGMSGAPTDMASSEESTTEEVGTPDEGTTQAAGSGVDSGNYSSFEEMLAEYQSDIAEVEAGDDYGNNIVELYDPTSYIGAEGTENPTWARILMGASEGDISMMNSLNLEIAWLSAGTDASIEWQWNGGHVPSEILGDTFSLYVDTMYGKHVDGAVEITKTNSTQTANGTATEASGTDISSWVTYDSTNGVSFSLADIAAYRTSGASKAIPGFDVMDYGQEDYVFGSSSKDARHWSKYVLQAFEENQDTLAGLFNQ